MHSLKMARHSENLDFFLSPQRADQGAQWEVFPSEINIRFITFSGIGMKISQLQKLPLGNGLSDL